MNLKYYIAKGLKIVLNPPALINCRIDKTARVCSRSELSNVSIGKYSYVGNQCFIVNTDIGKFCSIADKCCMGANEHPLEYISTSPVFCGIKNIMKKNFSSHPLPAAKKIVIGNDVWIGAGVYIKGGVTISDGAVIGMGSVVTKDVGPYEIWAGNPARPIRKRFSDEQIEELKKVCWWNWEDDTIEKAAVDFNSVKEFLDVVKARQ